ncbi:ATP-binding protein [Undibacterium sp. TJN25]|uniref:hybrid sensor histidine kinase/response regulator n=1 Tax=Undibacterium sp. TJN25 TaxID=3413056 RepID=UPI003BF376D8
MKIRTQLMFIAAATLLPVVVFSAVALNLLLEAERNAALKNLREAARAMALIVDSELGNADAALRVLATSRALASKDLRGFYEQAKSADRGPGSWTLLFNYNGEQLINTLLPFGNTLPSSADLLRVQASKMELKSVLEGVAGNRTYVSNLLKSPLTGRLVTTVNVPVQLPGDMKYLLTETFAADYFVRVLSHGNIPSSWTLAIIDRDGNFISRSRGADQLIGKPARPELIRAARDAQQGQIRHLTLEGVDSYDVFVHSALAGWTVAIAAPADQIELSARRAVKLAALGLLAAVLMAAVTAALVSRSLVRAIAGAAASAAAIGRAEVPAESITDIEEIDKLHAALNNAGILLRQELQSRQRAEAEREALLGNEQHARQLAEQQNTAKDQFLALLGHELRNPLSAISGAIRLMQMQPAGGVNPQHLLRAQEIIERQSKHLSHIVDDLLDLSRMSMGKISLNKKPLDLARVVKACVDALHTTGRTSAYTVSVAVESAWVDADATRLEQIISNLIGNALKFTPAGGKIDIKLKAEAASHTAVLMIHDNGIGISSELLPRVFDAFVQGVAQSDKALGGLGIGLHLVRQLVQLHGGEVSLMSAGADRGTTVLVRLPLLSEEARQAVVPVTAETAGAAPLSILLVEDNRDAREMMAALLDMHGHQVIEADTGEEGVLRALEHKPGIAIIDIGLPDIDGYQVAARIRSHPALRGTLLIALTGYGQLADQQRALGAGFDYHLVKPVDIDRLMDIIRGNSAASRLSV